MRKYMGKCSTILALGMLIAGMGVQEVSGAEISTQMKVEGNKTQILVNLQNPMDAVPVSLSFFHLVKQGDTAWSIAAKYGTTIKELAEMNQLDVSKPLLVNQRIAIPIDQPVGATKAGEDGVHVYLVVDEGNKAATKKHMVRSGETLYSIAQSYQVSIERLTEKNRLASSHQIKIGQTLEIPEKGKSSSRPYTVRPGDTLSRIARENGTSLDRLLLLNALNGKDPIFIGQKLELPS